MIKELSKVEFDSLLKEAPESETSNLKALAALTKLSPYQFLNCRALAWKGLIVNDRIIYFAAITKTSDNKYELWTIVNKDVKEQFTLFRETKKMLHKWLDYFPALYATMETKNEKNMRWVERLGFEVVSRLNGTVTYKLRRK